MRSRSCARTADALLETGGDLRSASAETQAHAASCAACGRLSVELRAEVALLRGALAAAALPTFALRSGAATRLPRATPRGRARRAAWLALPAAAAAVAAVWLGVGRRVETVAVTDLRIEPITGAEWGQVVTHLAAADGPGPGGPAAGVVLAGLGNMPRTGD